MRLGQSAKVNEKLPENLMKWDILPLKLTCRVKELLMGKQRSEKWLNERRHRTSEITNYLQAFIDVKQ
jgi:hypothetical protein